MPCHSKDDGDYEVVPHCLIDDYLYTRIKKSEDELVAEKKCVAHLIGESGGVCSITEDTMLPG
ncbi:hypothetical protein Mapa_001296 [Marchantia paleacea]|nr:hypothetical protein Mapa_001296 [Marchantia paleacea]